MKTAQRGLGAPAREPWTRGRWRRAGDLFEAAAARPAGEREAFLASRAADDAALRHRVEKMLEAADEGSGFLDRPLISALREEPPGRSPDPDDGARPGLAVAAADPRIGTRIGPYRLLENLGRGGMGSVYLARREDGVDRKVALKLVRPGLGPEVVRRFRSESALQARVEHPNVARLYDAGTAEDGNPYLVMEYVDGLPLTEACRRHRFSLEEKVDLFCRICAGVQAAHRSLLVHRDLKPANILVTARGVPKLLDFGVAKFLDPAGAESGSTLTGHRWMTPRYASPEQVRGQSLDTRSDVYSLGVVLFELLTGRSPYSASEDHPHDLERAVCEQPPPRPSEAPAAGATGAGDGEQGGRRRRARLRGDLDTIVLKALDKAPDRRYGSAEALAEDLRRWRLRRPILARPESGVYRLGKFLRRHRSAVFFTAAAALLFSILGALHLSQLVRHARAMDRGRAQAEQVSELLIEMLTTIEGAPPEKTGVTASDLLAAGLRKVGAAESQDPSVRASVLHTIGRVFHRLSRIPEAEESLFRSLALLRQAEDPAAGDTADVLHDLGAVQRKLGKLDEAESHLQKALEIRRQLRHRRPDRLADVLHDLAILSWDRLDLARAEAYFRQALHWRKLSAPTDPDSWIDSLQAVAELSGATDLMEEAAGLRRQQLERRRALLGGRHPEVAETLIDLGNLESRRGERWEAVKLYRQAYEGLLEAVGPDHAQTLRSLQQLAAAVGMVGRYEEAEAFYRQALETVPDGIPEDHPETLFAVHNLAVILSYQGKFPEAEVKLRQVLAGAESRYPDDSCKTAPVYFSLAASFHLQGRFEEAETHYRLAEEVCDDQDLKRPYLPTDVALAYLRFDQGRGREACPGPLLRLESTNYPGAGDPAVEAEIQALRGACLAVQGDIEAGLDALRSAHEVLSRHRGAGYPVVRWIEQRLLVFGGRRDSPFPDGPGQARGRGP